MARILSRWLMSAVLAVLTLVAINYLVAASPAQGKPAAALINCSESIQACISAANDGDTILIAAGKYTESLTLSKPVSLTGENRDTTIIHAIEGQRVLTVTNATIDNSVVISGLTFTGGNADYGGGIYVEGAPLHLIDVSVISNTAQQGGGGIYATNAVTLSNVDVLSNTANDYAGGAYASVAHIVHSRFEGNDSAVGYGGGLNALILFLTDTEFLNNRAGDSGGGARSASAFVSGSRFENNVSSSGGGGGLSAGQLAMTDTVFVSNTSYYGGGGLASSPYGASIAGSRFENNRTTGTQYSGGGGAYVSGEVSLTDVDFVSNTAFGAGGLFARDIVTLTNVDFVRNSGGGAVLGGPSTIIGGHFIDNQGGGLGTDRDTLISGTAFISNSADIGGGLYANYTATLYNARFERNVATTYGGGLFAEHVYIISGAEFINNTATTGGGATIGELQFMTNTSFVGNMATQSGGGLWAGARSASIANTLFTRNAAGATGAAMSLSAGEQVTIVHSTIASTTLVPVAAVNLDNWINGHVNIVDTIIASHTIAISNTDATVYEDYNLFFSNVTNTTSVFTGTHSLVGDPKFVDPLNGDYHLHFGSAAIDHGVGAGVYTDLDGNIRPHGAGFDIGAYEFVNDTRYVATTGDDTGNVCLDQTAPCATVQHAIDVANDGDQVLIASGLYTQSTTLDKPVSVTGVNSATTILHAVAGQRVLTVIGGTINSSVVISGLTFTGGNVADLYGYDCPYCGGGIALLAAAQPLIDNALIVSNQAGIGGGIYADFSTPVTMIGSELINNSAQHWGGGIYANGALTLTASRIDRNDAIFGGGVFANHDNVVVVETAVVSNTALGAGGGILAFGTTTLVDSHFENNRCVGESCEGGGIWIGTPGNPDLFITGTVFINNATTAVPAPQYYSATGGGVYYSAQGHVAITNTLFERNSAPNPGAALFIYWATSGSIVQSTIVGVTRTSQTAIALHMLNGPFSIANTIIANHAVAISNTGGSVYEDYNLFFNTMTNTVNVTSGGHSLVGDPKFVDPLNGDYHLQFGSAAIDRGVDVGVHTDLDGNLRPVGAGFDIGAYEYQGSVTYMFLPLMLK